MQITIINKSALADMKFAPDSVFTITAKTKKDDAELVQTTTKLSIDLSGKTLKDVVDAALGAYRVVWQSKERKQCKTQDRNIRTVATHVPGAGTKIASEGDLDSYFDSMSPEKQKAFIAKKTAVKDISADKKEQERLAAIAAKTNK